MFTTKSAAILALMLCATPGAAFAQDAMAPAPMAGDAMAPAPMAGDAMMAAPMSDADLQTCLDQSAMVTFAPAMQAASDACHAMHNDAMGGDAMGAMAPAQ